MKRVSSFCKWLYGELKKLASTVFQKVATQIISIIISLFAVFLLSFLQGDRMDVLNKALLTQGEMLVEVDKEAKGFWGDLKSGLKSLELRIKKDIDALDEKMEKKLAAFEKKLAADREKFNEELSELKDVETRAIEICLDRENYLLLQKNLNGKPVVLINLCDGNVKQEKRLSIELCLDKESYRLLRKHLKGKSVRIFNFCE